MIREQDPRFKNLERKIGIFIALALIGIAVALVLFGLQKDLFSSKYNLHFTVDRGTGFTKGMPVKLSGFRIGRVTSIALNDQAMVDIAIEIDKKYQTWIRNDSIVKLVKEGLVGDTIVEVSVGSLDKPELKNNEAISYVKTKALDELAEEIADKVKPVLIEVRDIIGYINDPNGDLKKSIHNLEVLTRNLEGTRRNADRLLISANGNIDRIAGQAGSVLDTTNRKIESIDLTPTLNKVNGAIDTLDKKLPPLLDKADETLGNVARISRDTRTKLPGLLSQTEDVMFSTDKLLNSLQNTWLLRDSSPPPASNQLFIKGDSYE
ncbi:MCE family protein [Oryzomonas sagensis]|uniref:MCE family protein n=1 Tax=Oryzomonas sagensis TaxID=2603857 RepID=A0ABQ6TNV5_9BACT|nr:MlaD family protein [Oryzomonas sagensis]KAB0669840.1 MCE family protein [Oryzomonas sagensis]